MNWQAWYWVLVGLTWIAFLGFMGWVAFYEPPERRMAKKANPPDTNEKLLRRWWHP